MGSALCTGGEAFLVHRPPARPVGSLVPATASTRLRVHVTASLPTHAEKKLKGHRGDCPPRKQTVCFKDQEKPVPEDALLGLSLILQRELTGSLPVSLAMTCIPALESDRWGPCLLLHTSQPGHMIPSLKLPQSVTQRIMETVLDNMDRKKKGGLVVGTQRVINVNSVISATASRRPGLGLCKQARVLRGRQPHVHWGPLPNEAHIWGSRFSGAHTAHTKPPI